MIALKIARDLLWAAGDTLDLLIHLHTPSVRGVEVHKFYEQANA